MASPRRTPTECPVCGADVPANAKACPECGADERTGWNEEMTLYDGMELPDSAFDLDHVTRKPLAKRRRQKVFVGVAIALIILLVLAALGLR